MKVCDRRRRIGRATLAGPIVAGALALAGCNGQYADSDSIDLEASARAAKDTPARPGGPARKGPVRVKRAELSGE